MEAVEHWSSVLANAKRKFPPSEFRIIERTDHDGLVLQIFQLSEMRPILTLIFNPTAAIIHGEHRVDGKTEPVQFNIIDARIDPDIYAFFDLMF